MTAASSESPSATPETTPEQFPFRNGQYGFHYGRDESLAAVLEHGLLSRLEEKRRGLNVRPKASRSVPDTLYFTTEPDQLYLYKTYAGPEDQIGDSPEVQAEHAVAIVVDRPLYANRPGHFGIKDVVEPNDFKALLFLDMEARQTREGVSPGRPTHEFERVKDPDWVTDRVAMLRQACLEAGLDIPICGISGQTYYSPVPSVSE